MNWTASGDQNPARYQTNLEVLSFQQRSPGKKRYLDSSPSGYRSRITIFERKAHGAIAVTHYLPMAPNILGCYPRRC